MPATANGQRAATLFKSRLGMLSLLFGAGFLAVLGRLWQLQVTRFDKYWALANRDTKTEQMVPAMRGPIYDRYGDLLAHDSPVFDISVRVDRVPLEGVRLEEVKQARELFRETREREAEFDKIALRLEQEPYVRGLASTLDRTPEDIASGLLRAFDTVARNWASPRTPLRIAGNVDEKIWLALRGAHEDGFRDSRLLLGKIADEMPEAQQPPFPGLVCTLSTRRVYPHGRLACFALGYLGELGADDEEALKRDGILLDNAAARSRYWRQLRDAMDDDKSARLEQILRVQPQEIQDLSELYRVLSRLRPAELQAAAACGLAEPVRWIERPPRMQLTEPEMIWLGVGLPLAAARNPLPNRLLGESGIEQVYNNFLRGKSGMKILAARGESGDLAFRGNSQPRPGEALPLTISIAWQSAAEKALRGQEHAGAVVVLDARNGEVLAMASNPDFDPNLFAPPRDGAARQEKLRALLNDPAKPLLNRAISEQYPLGSIMKSLIAAVALEKGLVNTSETFECPGYIIEGGQRFRCDDSRAHGTVNLLKGLRCSCNVTFHQIGARIGVERLGPHAKLLLGRRSGLDLPGEVPGIYPDLAWRAKTYPNNPSARLWTKGNEFQLAIGQGQMTCTVMQAALMMAAIGNGGDALTPRLWLEAPASPRRNLGIGAANLAIVRQGLDQVVNIGTPGERGTAYSPFHEQGPELAVRVAGKTSTAEHGRGAKAHAWFAGYAPAENPQVAFAVLLEEAGHGGATAAPVAYKFLKEVYGTRQLPNKNPGAPRQQEPVAMGETR